MALEHVVQLQPLLATLNAGDQLRLSIAAAAWPAIGVNPGDGTTPSGAPSPQHRVVTLTLHLTDSKLQLIPMNSGKLDGE
jgi:predicted acyl esterase